jgi:DNA-binding transcriptional LysR family regulator
LHIIGMASPVPSIDSLRCFVEAARFLNFRAAARSVSLTPAALGQRIRQLEELMACQLFHRTTRSVSLTEQGMALLPHARRTIEEAELCVRAAQGELAPPDMDITIGTRHELGLSWLVPIIPQLRSNYPNLTVHLYFGSGTDLLTRTRSQEIDCAITSTRMMDPRLEGRQLRLEQYVFVGEAELMKRLPLRDPTDAREHALIDINQMLPLFRYWRDAPGGIDSLEFASVRQFGTIAAIRSLILQGEGVGVLPRYFVANDIAEGKLVTIMDNVEPLSDYFRLVFRADDPRRGLLDSLATTLGEYPLQ